MQVEVDVKCMQTNFNGHDLSGFGVMAPFYMPSKQSKFPFEPWTIFHGGQKIESAQKIHTSRGWREMHGNQQAQTNATRNRGALPQ